MKISVVIATYNRKELLKKCLASLDQQTFKDFEVILVDDGSTDGTEELKDRVDIYKYKKHTGISDTFNTGMELVNGEYFFIMGSDDKITPDCLEVHLNKIENTGADLVFGHYLVFGDGQKEIVYKYEIQNFHQCYMEKKIPHCGLYRTSTLGHFRYDTKIESAVDYDYILTILKEFPQIKMAVINKALYHHRINHQQERGSSRQIISIGIIRNKHRTP